MRGSLATVLVQWRGGHVVGVVVLFMNRELVITMEEDALAVEALVVSRLGVHDSSLALDLPLPRTVSRGHHHYWRFLVDFWCKWSVRIRVRLL